MNQSDILGIDLAGSSKRKTGFAFLLGNKVIAGILYSDEEIINLARKFNLILIDAPLSIPKGRKSLEDRKGPHLRECDVLLRELGIKFFPVTLGPMRMLARRGIRIKLELEGMGKKVLETFPGAVYDTLGVDRNDKHKILTLYRSLGLEVEDREYSQDELDAIASLIVGIRYISGNARILSGEDGEIVIL